MSEPAEYAVAPTLWEFWRCVLLHWRIRPWRRCGPCDFFGQHNSGKWRWRASGRRMMDPGWRKFGWRWVARIAARIGRFEWFGCWICNEFMAGFERGQTLLRHENCWLTVCLDCGPEAARRNTETPEVIGA